MLKNLRGVGRHFRRGPALCILVMLVATEAMYLRPSFLAGRSLMLGYDFFELHVRRMEYARASLAGPHHTLPGWYSHEFMGTPFAANLQSFPWIPTRLALLPFDPNFAFGIGVALAAALAAIFTYLFCRRSGLSPPGAAAAGWTFACAGYFISRVLAGHLPLLEAYPALPLLLWLADRALSPDRANRAVRDLLALAIASGCVALAGHPQVPAYALATAALFVMFRGRGKKRLQAIGAMIAGLGLTLAAWWPMLLFIQRSFRVLHLSQPDNDIVLPYGRLLALIIPGINGWVDGLEPSATRPFSGYPNTAYFWDTTSYVGLLPLAVLAALFFRFTLKRRWPAWPWSFLTIAGLAALLLALPLSAPLRNLTPGTFLRSPARLLYISTFSASVALGYGVSAILKSRLVQPVIRCVLVAALLVFHAFDLGSFGHLFVQTTSLLKPLPPPYQATLDREVGDGRIAFDFEYIRHFGDRYDSAGVFDSLLLANPYRTMIKLMGRPADFNTQLFDALDFTLPALQAAAARFVITTEEPDWAKNGPADSSDPDVNLYAVPDPAARASLVPDFMVEFLPQDKIVDAFAAQSGPQRLLLLPADAQALSKPSGAAIDHSGPTASYSRPWSDEIRVDTVSDRSGFAYLVEAYDPGWSATIDGRPAPVVLANGFAMAVPAPPGKHTIRLIYHTPGRKAGALLSLLSACALVGLLFLSRRLT